MEHKTVTLSDPDRWLAEGGEMGKLILAKDWQQTPLGAIEDWQSSLKTAVRILLHSRYPMFIWWGNDHINLYNDSYMPILGKRHPEALGRPARDSWADIWSVVGPQAQLVLKEGKATWNEETLLLMERYGYTEETYFTFSYSPAPNDTGGIGGVFCACTEDTERVLSKRRLQILRALSAQVVQSVELTCGSAAQVLEQNPRDLPFALIYLLDADGKTARLAGTTNISIGTKASSPLYHLNPSEDSWLFREVIRSGEEQVITDLEDRFGALPGGDWQESPKQAVVLPLTKASQSTLVGFFVAGISPRLQFDDNYRGFMKLVAGHLATAITNAGAYEEERRRSEALAELDRAKTTFFSNVSHEFRTPLTLMLSPLEQLLEETNGSLNPEQRHELELAQRSGLRLLKLVNTLLDFSRLEAGRVQAVYEAVDLAEYTAELASVFRSAVEKAGLRLVVNCPPLSEAVYVDREMWEKIVLNLLSNAFKFTFAGEIEVSLKETDGAVELRVRDTGVGIPEAELGHIFERFYRSKESRGRTYEGTGIGLSLVQELARSHGGTVTVASVAGEGSIFTVTIPKGSAHLPKDHLQKARSLDAPSRRILPFIEEAGRWLPDADGEQWSVVSDQLKEIKTDHRSPTTDHFPRILLADDNADMREYVQRLLSPQFAVEAVADGLAALEAARQHPPDLVLSDVMMPRLDGFGLLKALRDDEATRTIPILLLSARAGEESKIEGLDAGADDYLVKPFSARELLARVRLHLKMAQIRREAAESIRESEERFRKAFSASPHLVTISTLDEGRYLAVNDAVLKKTGYSREEMVGHTATELNIFPDSGGRGRLVEALRRAPVRDLEITVRTKSGEDQLLSLSADTIPFDGKPCIITAAVDITERKRLEMTLRDSREFLRGTIDALTSHIAVLDRKGTIIEVNSAWREFADLNAFRGHDFGIGTNYIEVCTMAGNEAGECDPFGLAAAEGIRQVINGERDLFTLEYPCHSPTDLRWFVMRVTRFNAGEHLRLVVAHENITEQRLAEVSLRQSEDRYRAFVTQSSEAIWRFELEQPVDITLPADSQIERFYQYAYLAECNDRMAQMYGFAKAEEIIGTRLYELLLPTDTANLDYLRAFITSGYRLTEAESHEVDRDGSQHYFLNNLVGIVENQHLTRAWGTQRDITDRKIAEQQREELLHKEQQARAMAEEANRLKDDFLATVSHELRTPLNAILGWAKMVSSSDDTLLMRQALEVITRNAYSQNQIISDILDVSRIITGKLNLSMAKMDLIPVIEAAIETVRPAATAKMIRLETRFDASGQRVLGDANRLQQVVWNLLSNAVKFTPENGRILIQLQRHDQQLELSVSDSGEGIDSDFLPFAFDRFRQGESGASRKHGGLGLGLAIVRHLVELHGGTVEVESQGKGHGTTFRIRLPLLAVTSERRSPVAEPEIENGQREPFSPVLAGRRILVIDDDEDGRSLLDFLLAQSGATVSLAASVADALRQLEDSLPDVVISDIGMSEQDGYDFIRALRVQHQHLPAIALTAYARVEDRQRALQEGFTQYLSKPLEPEELIAVVAELVRRS